MYDLVLFFSVSVIDDIGMVGAGGGGLVLLK
jgi:hypothetical protein